ncbi:hypothetical protein KC887_07245 [Candidatus Kaiserbacteria bacterium]|nr:hypothetical protein [Candidatus Kaiserbacteria bacterium]
MDPKLQEQLDSIELRLGETKASVDKMLWYMKVTAWVTIAVIVLPLIGLLFAIPALLRTMNEAMSLVQF